MFLLLIYKQTCLFFIASLPGLGCCEVVIPSFTGYSKDPTSYINDLSLMIFTILSLGTWQMRSFHEIFLDYLVFGVVDFTYSTDILAPFSLHKCPSSYFSYYFQLCCFHYLFFFYVTGWILQSMLVWVRMLIIDFGFNSVSYMFIASYDTVKICGNSCCFHGWSHHHRFIIPVYGYLWFQTFELNFLLYNVKVYF